MALTFTESDFTDTQPASKLTFSEADFAEPAVPSASVSFRPGIAPRLDPTGELSATAGMPQGRVAGSPGALQDLGRQVQTGMKEAWQSRQQGIVSPEDVPTGTEMTKTTGIPRVLTVPASAVGKTAAGVVSYATSPQGLTEMGAAATPAAPAVFAKWAYDMLKGGYESVADATDAIGQKINEAFSRGVVSANNIPKPPEVKTRDEFVQHLAENAVNSAVMLLGGASAGLHAVKGGARILTPKPSPSAIALATAETPTPNAQTIRADTRPLPTPGQVPQGSETPGRHDLEQPSPGQPQPLDPREEKTRQVPLTHDQLLAKAAKPMTGVSPAQFEQFDIERTDAAKQVVNQLEPGDTFIDADGNKRVVKYVQKSKIDDPKLKRMLVAFEDKSFLTGQSLASELLADRDGSHGTVEKRNVSSEPQPLNPREKETRQVPLTPEAPGTARAPRAVSGAPPETSSTLTPEQHAAFSKIGEGMGFAFDGVSEFPGIKPLLSFTFKNLPQTDPVYGATFHPPANSTPEEILTRARQVADKFRSAAIAPEPQPAISAIADTKTHQPVDFPIKQITLSKDVPNFKAGADPETGIVPGERLTGKYQRLGTAPIVIWERLNGTHEVITGRHRLDLAKRSGETTIPAQIVREAAGFTQEKALTFDAEANIRDGQGSIEDYAHYFKNTPTLSETEARTRGLLDRVKSQDAFRLARSASDDLYSLWQDDKIPTEKAVAISRAAPGNADLQALGVKQAFKGRSPAELENFIKAVQSQTGGKPEQVDLFGRDDTAIKQAEEMASRASERQKSIADEIKAVQNSAKNPTLAAKHGVDVKDPQGTLKKVAELKSDLDRWQNGPLHPDLVAEVGGKSPPLPPTGGEGRGEGIVNAPTTNPKPTAPGPPTIAPGATAGELFPAAEAPFNLASETAKMVTPKTEQTAFGAETLSQNELFGIQEVVKEVDPGKSANAAQRLAGGDSAKASAMLRRQLAIMATDPKSYKAFDKKQRARLKEVIALLDQRAGNKSISVGPGAASAVDVVGPSPDAAIVAALQNIPRTKNVLGQLRLGERAANVLAQGQNVFASALTKAKTLGQITHDLLIGRTKLDTFDKLTYEADAMRQRGSGNAREIRKAAVRTFKSPDEREAMNNWLQAQTFDDPAATLRTWAQASRAKADAAPSFIEKQRFLKTARLYEAAGNLTPPQRTAALQAEQFWRSKGEQLVQDGVLRNLLEDYMGPHLVNGRLALDPSLNALRADFAAGRLSTNFKFAMRRVFETEFDLEQAGHTLKTKDLFGKLANYLEQAEHVKANRWLVKQLKDGSASTGDPWIDFRVTRTLPEGEPPGAVLIKPNRNPGNPGDYVALDHPALRGWRWAAKDDQGRNVFVEADAWAHREIAAKLRNTIQRSSLYQLPGVETLTRGVQELKGMKFSGTLFHPVQLAIHKTFHLSNPFELKPVDPNSPTTYQYMKWGLKLYDREGLEGFTQGITTGRLAQRVPVYGHIARASAELCWDHLFPSFKTELARDILARNQQRYSADPQGLRGAFTTLLRAIPGAKKLRPVMTPDEIGALSMVQANFAMGGHPWRAMSVSPEFTHALHLSFRAPDFLASRLGFVARAGTKLGAEERLALAVGSLSLYTFSRMANYALSGNPHNDDPFAVYIGPRRYTLRSVMGDSVNFIKEPVRWWMHRLSPLVSGPMEIASKVNAFGKAVTRTEALRDVAYEALPIPATPRSDVRWYESMLDSMGLHTSRYNPAAVMYGKAGDFLKAQGKEKPPGIYPESQYTQLRQYLQDNQRDKAAREYNRLRTAGHKYANILQALQSRPFTGSLEMEAKFKQSLSPNDRQLYQQAQAEQKQLLFRFKALF